MTSKAKLAEIRRQRVLANKEARMGHIMNPGTNSSQEKPVNLTSAKPAIDHSFSQSTQPTDPMQAFLAQMAQAQNQGHQQGNGTTDSPMSLLQTLQAQGTLQEEETLEKMIMSLTMLFIGGIAGWMYASAESFEFSLAGYDLLINGKLLFSESWNIVIALEVMMRLSFWLLSGDANISNLLDRSAGRLMKNMKGAMGILQEFSSDCAVYLVSFVLVSTLYSYLSEPAL